MSNLSNAGVIRRIDELGRVVIPMEYRKMFRMNVGDPLEIIATSNNEIILRKVGVESEFISNSKVVLESLETDATLLVSDKFRWRLGVGASKGIFLDKYLDAKMLNAVNTRKGFSDKLENVHVFAEPILGVDCLGLIMLVSGKEISDSEISNIRFLAKIIAGLTEKY